MKPTNNIAFKEWAVVVSALGAGRQVIILRKGGIHEKRGGFTIEHREFFLFPTFLHQSREDLIPLVHAELDQLQAAPHDETKIPFAYYAVVEDVRRVEDLALVHQLAGHHVLSASAVDERFHYRNNPGVHVLALRVYRLPAPHVLPALPAYGGCVSWVELDQELSTAGAVPVLSDAAFAERLAAVRTLLAPVPAI